jgi:hypothetical protein
MYSGVITAKNVAPSGASATKTIADARPCAVSALRSSSTEIRLRSSTATRARLRPIRPPLRANAPRTIAKGAISSSGTTALYASSASSTDAPRAMVAAARSVASASCRGSVGATSTRASWIERPLESAAAIASRSPGSASLRSRAAARSRGSKRRNPLSSRRPRESSRAATSMAMAALATRTNVI